MQIIMNALGSMIQSNFTSVFYQMLQHKDNKYLQPKLMLLSVHHNVLCLEDIMYKRRVKNN